VQSGVLYRLTLTCQCFGPNPPLGIVRSSACAASATAATPARPSVAKSVAARARVRLVMATMLAMANLLSKVMRGGSGSNQSVLV